MFHVHTDLMGTACLQAAFDERDIRKTLQHAPMCDGLFGLWAFFEIPDSIDRAVSVVAGKGPFDCSAVFFEGSPDEGIVGAFGRVVKELLGQMGLGFGGLGDKQQTGGVLVDTMDEADGGVIYINL